jgi:ATP-dependent DNA helicase DinG
VWDNRTAILTSATIPTSLADRVGLPADGTDVADVGSPFDYPTNALLYCAKHLPDPRSAQFRPAVHEELAGLITAAGGRTLALFTSWRAMDEAAAAVRATVPYTILTQRDMPKPALVRAFAADDETCLFATAGLFQGVDVPGSTLSLVVIDRIPFPRPDDPLLSARRELLGPSAFGQIDLPRAAMLLAQACGRLIRTATDRGVVAVLDPRLATARYRWDIVSALPPMRRTGDRAEAEQFLRGLVPTLVED